MANRKRDHARQFWRAAGMRLLAAEHLALARHHGQFGVEAVYFAGYCVECILKALLLSRTPAGKWIVLLDQISKGNKGHSFEMLRARLRRERWIEPLLVVKAFQSVAWWKTKLRYSTRQIPADDVHYFVAAAREILA